MNKHKTKNPRLINVRTMRHNSTFSHNIPSHIAGKINSQEVTQSEREQKISFCFVSQRCGQVYVSDNRKYFLLLPLSAGTRTFLFMFHLNRELRNERREDTNKKNIQHVLLIYQSNVMLIFNVRSLGTFCFANVRNFVQQVCSRLSVSFTFIFVGVVGLTIRRDETWWKESENQFPQDS